MVQQDVWVQIQSLCVPTVYQVLFFFLVVFKKCVSVDYGAIDLIILWMVVNI